MNSFTSLHHKNRLTINCVDHHAMTVDVNSSSTQDTLNFGHWLGSRLASGAVVGLNGPLGTGKTWLVKGIVAGLGGYDTALVKSPAYNLIHEYVLQNPQRIVFHIDFYRLDSLSPQDAQYFSEVLESPDAIKLIEWASPHLEALTTEILSTKTLTGTKA